MNKEQLPPVLLTQRRYAGSIPSGKISQFSPTQVPIISKKGTFSRQSNHISMHDVTDPTLIQQKLRSLSHSETDVRISLQAEKKQKANLKFLRYKFNPGSKQEDGENIENSHSELYGQLKRPGKQKISVNIFYQHKNVLFQDERAPLVFRRLFLQKQKLQ